MKTIKDLILNENKKNIYIAGGGQYGKIVAKYLEKNGIKHVGVVDRKVKNFMGGTTITYDQLNAKDKYIVASLDYEYGIQIKKELVSRGVNIENIYSIDKLEIIKEFFEVLNDYSKKYAPGIKEFKDKYKGETCFIIGNGPSLRVEDLDKLVGKHCFAANGIYKMYSYTDWRPEFYFAQDATMTQNVLLEDIEKVLESKIFTSINSPLVDFSETYDNIKYMRLYYAEDESGLPKFSMNCDEIMYLSRTVTYSMMQMAVYMGFKTIYLLGIDCSYQYEKSEDGTIIHNNVKNNVEKIDNLYLKWDKCLQSTDEELPEVFQNIKGYKVAKKYAENNDSVIYNATRGGKLEVFERVDFDSLF